MTNHHRRNWIFNKRTQNYEKASNVLCYKIAIGDYDYDAWVRIQKKYKRG